MELVRQTESGLCLAACVAMVADCTLEEVCGATRILTREGVRYLPDNEAIKFLASRFLCYGLRIKLDTKLADDIDEFTVRVTLDCRAILTVLSENFRGFHHAVVWCNERKRILDPLLDEPQSITRYDVLEWAAISHV